MDNEAREKSELVKAAAKEAFREFLDDKWTQLTSSVGKWVLGAIAAAFVVAVVWLILTANGWRVPQ